MATYTRTIRDLTSGDEHEVDASTATIAAPRDITSLTPTGIEIPDDEAGDSADGSLTSASVGDLVYVQTDDEGATVPGTSTWWLSEVVR